MGEVNGPLWNEICSCKGTKRKTSNLFRGSPLILPAQTRKVHHQQLCGVAQRPCHFRLVIPAPSPAWFRDVALTTSAYAVVKPRKFRNKLKQFWLQQWYARHGRCWLPWKRKKGMGIGSNKGMTPAHLNTVRDFFPFFPALSHKSPLLKISSCSSTAAPLLQSCCACPHNHRLRCLATQFLPVFGSPAATSCGLILPALAHDCLLLLPSSFSG